MLALDIGVKWVPMRLLLPLAAPIMCFHSLPSSAARHSRHSAGVDQLVTVLSYDQTYLKGIYATPGTMRSSCLCGLLTVAMRTVLQEPAVQDMSLVPSVYNWHPTQVMIVPLTVSGSLCQTHSVCAVPQVHSEPFDVLPDYAGESRLV